MSILAALACAIAVAGGGQAPQRPPIKLQIGDSVEVTTVDAPYGGSFRIMNDGAIYGRGFGRLVVEGKTWNEIEPMVRKAMAKYVRPELIFVTIKPEKQDVVYLVGLGEGKGPVPLLPGMDLRQLLASATLDQDADKVEVKHFRGGRQLANYNVGELLKTDVPSKSLELKSDDVVTLSPVEFIRVWTTGKVDKPGEIKLPVGSDVYQAIASSGGSAKELMEQELTVFIRRGPQTIVAPLRQNPNEPPVRLENNDTVLVQGPDFTRITVTGEVENPGEYVARGKSGLTNAIALAGGMKETGTLSKVLVFRKGELLQVDATGPVAGGKEPEFVVEPGDVVFVRRNERSFYVLGEVNQAKRVPMEDAKNYRVTDALALAGGLNTQGSLRRVYIARAGADGKTVIKQFNLDEFLKDGKIESNPEVLPGDAILFGQPKGVGINGITQLLSSFVIIDSLSRR